MEWLLIWIGGAILVAVVASNKGRSGAGWFILALLLSPLLALIAVAVMSRIEPQEAMKTCPRCAENVKFAAAVCRHCGYEFVNAPRQENYNGLPYVVHADGTVSMTIEGKTRSWPNLAVFQQEIDKKRAKLPKFLRT